MTWVFVTTVITIFGFNTIFWSAVGVGRWLVGKRPQVTPPRPHLYDPQDVAVLIAAHNEALVIEQTIISAANQVPIQNIFVVSDGSHDATVKIVRRLGAHVRELTVNRGKAAALQEGVRYFNLTQKYTVIMVLDADTVLSDTYLRTGLPLFNDPTVSAVAGRATTLFQQSEKPSTFGRFLLAYRERLYVTSQLLLKYGQAAKWADAVVIVPGFASMYRASALNYIDIAGAGLIIEDFNMTFDLHSKRLGRIEFQPSAAVAYTQDPITLSEYRRQVRRWILGFWQTVRRHRVQRNIFQLALSAYIAEVVFSSVALLVLVPLSMLLLILEGAFAALHLNLTLFDQIPLPLALIFLGVFLPDYLLTVFTVIVKRRPSFLLYGLGFILIRFVDAWLCLATLFTASHKRSSGVWVSPKRRDLRSVPTPDSSRP